MTGNDEAARARRDAFDPERAEITALLRKSKPTKAERARIKAWHAERLRAKADHP